MEKYDISRFICKPIMETPCKDVDLMWIGTVKPYDIDELLIPDCKERECLINLTWSFIDAIINLKKCIYQNTDSFKEAKKVFVDRDLFENEKKALIDIEKQLSDKISDLINNGKMNNGIYGILLCNEFDKVKNSNPNEFENKTFKNALEAFENYINNGQGYFGISYDPNGNEFNTVVCATQKQSEKYGFRENNIEKFNEFTKALIGKDNPTKQEIEEVKYEIFSSITLSDLLNIYYDQHFGLFSLIGIRKNALLGMGYSVQEISKLSLTELDELMEKVYNNKVSIDEHEKYVEKAVMSTIDYVSVEKLILCYAANKIGSFESLSAKYEDDKQKDNSVKEETEVQQKGTEEIDEPKFIKYKSSSEDFFQKMSQSEIYMRNLLKSNMINNKISIVSILNGRVDIGFLRKNISKFKEGIYLSNPICDVLVEKSRNKIDDLSEEVIARIIELNPDYKMYFVFENPNNLKKLYSMGLISKEDIKNMLSTVGEPGKIKKLSREALNNDILHANRDLTEEILEEACQTEVIGLKDAKEYYDSGIIKLGALDEVASGVVDNNELKDVFNDEMLLGCYKELAQKILEYKKALKEDIPEEEKDKIRAEMNNAINKKETILKLYNRCHDLSDENVRKSNGNELLGKYLVEMQVDDESMLQESMELFYNDKLITFENIVDFSDGNEYLMNMLDKLTLADFDKIRKIRKDDKIRPFLDEIFSNDNLNDDQKFVILMSLFVNDNSEEGKEILKEYRKKLHINGQEKKARATGKKKKPAVKEHNNEVKVYSDITKWKFFNALDKDASAKRYDNGFVVFTSPKFGYRIIERYYEKNGIDLARGVATYIMSEEDWRKNVGNLVTLIANGEILEGAEVREIVPNTDRIMHRTRGESRTWMDELTGYFNIDFDKDTRYTADELKTLKNVIDAKKHDYIPL